MAEYKELVKAQWRETAALADNSFAFVDNGTVKDVSFDMSFVAGTNVRSCAQFYVNQGDKGVSCLPTGVGGVSHELVGMLFYNLYAAAGGW